MCLCVCVCLCEGMHLGIYIYMYHIDVLYVCIEYICWDRWMDYMTLVCGIESRKCVLLVRHMYHSVDYDRLPFSLFMYCTTHIL